MCGSACEMLAAMRHDLPRVHGAGGGTTQPVAATPVEAPNTLRSKAVAEVLCVIGEGPIVEPDDVYSQLYLDGVVVKSADGTYNFQNVEAVVSLGYPDQAYIPGTAAAESVIAIDQELTYGSPVVHAITDTTATGARAAITIPALVRVDATSGNRLPTTVQILIEVQPDGGAYTTVVTDKVHGKCISPVQLDYEVALDGDGPWNVRISRLTADSNSDSLLNETHWSSLSVLRDYRLAYPDTAVLRLRIDAEQFSGAFPTIEYQGDFLILQIPSNYDPVERTYSGIWDGTFVSAWTNNPAWVVWAIITNPRWGLGRWVDSGAVDKWSMYNAGVWFDEQVSDGRGGTEPRLTFNGGFDSPAKAYDAILTVVGACQSMTYWASGAVQMVVDKPDDPVRQVGPANVIDGKFVYEGSDLATRPTAVYVTWFDPDNGFKRAVEIVEDADMIAMHGLRIREVAAVLCTSQGQAHRVGAYELETAWSETQGVSFVVGEDQHDAAPGDLVDIADPSIQGRRMAGRIMAISGTSITLDDEVLIESGQTYELRVADSTGALQTRAVVAAAGSYSTIDVSSAYSPEPLRGAMWMLIASNLAPRRFRIISSEEHTDENTYLVRAVLHDPNKQARVEGAVVLDLPAITAYSTGPIDAVVNLGISEGIERLPSGTYRHRVILGWARHTDPRVVSYEIQYLSYGDDFWTPAGYSPGTTSEIDELGSGSFQFRVRAIGFDGAFSPWSVALTESLVGLDAAPPDVEDPILSVIGATALLSWATVVVANLDHYEVRFSTDTGANWQSMTPIALRVSGTSTQVGARTGIYAIKAVTAQGIESANMASILCNVDGLVINVVETLNAHPTWPGTMSQVEFEDARDAIKLSIESGFEVYESGSYTWPTYLDLGEIYTSRVTGTLVAFGEDTTDDIWDAPDVWALSTVWGSDPTGWDAYFEVRTTEDDPSGTPTWTDWVRLVISDLRFRAIEARLILKRGTLTTVTPIITQASLIVDMPDRVDAQSGLLVGIGGTRVTFEYAFRGPPVPPVVITGIGGTAAGDWADVSNVDVTGFDIYIRNSAGVAVSGRSIHYHAQGYGKVLPVGGG